MARRRHTQSSGSDRFADSRVETWSAEADRAAVESAGTDPAALAAVTGGLHDFMRFSTIPDEKRAEWALASLAAGCRCRAIVTWAEVNNVAASQALNYFIGEAQTI